MSKIEWAQAGIDPKRKYRFKMSFGNTGMQSYFVKTATVPKANISTVEHSYFDYNFKFPGRVTWDPISVTMVAPANETNDPTSALYDVLLKSGYSFPDSEDASTRSLSRTGFQRTAGFTDINLNILDGQGARTDSWVLKNCFLTNIDFGGSLDYTSDDLIEIAFEIVFDWAERNNKRSA